MARTQELFSIGDVAQLFHLSVSSLRHYETIGLLTPEYTDPATGYRYYGPRQFEVLNTIRYLRALDMPLGQIRAFLRNRDVGRIEQLLREQKAAVVRKQAELQRVERKIDNRLRQLHDAQTAELGAIHLVRSPACRVVWMSGALELHSFLDMEPSIRMLERSQAEAVVFLGKVGVGLSAERLAARQFAPYDRAFLVLDDDRPARDDMRRRVLSRQPPRGPGAVCAPDGLPARARARSGGLLARDHDDRLRSNERPGQIRDRDPHPRPGCGMNVYAKPLRSKWI